MSTVVEIENLSQGYGRKRVIQDLSLQLGERTVGLLGPNGAGKTTLIRTIATLMPAQTGSVIIDGIRVRSSSDARTARSRIGYLPQDFGFFPAFTCKEFLEYCCWLKKLDNSTRGRDVSRVLSLLNLEAQRDKRVKTLSGGMVRRLGIAQALLGDPRLLLLDEPTVGLDPEQRLDFRQVVRGLPPSCILISTHLIEDVAATCDEVAVMSAGRIVFHDTPDRLAAAAADAASHVGGSTLERGYVQVLGSRGASQ